MKIGQGADVFGVELKETVMRHLEGCGHECVDVGGTPEAARPYYGVTHEVAARVGSGPSRPHRKGQD